MDEFDVFLSHNGKDKPLVRRLAKALQRRGLLVGLDEWHLVPGHPWQEGLEVIIRSAKSIAILIGQQGLGPWERPELRASLNQHVKRKVPVIPVLLPGTKGTPELPLFLQDLTWVDLREGIRKEGLDRLVWGITAGLKVEHVATRPLSMVGESDGLRLVEVSIEETEQYPRLGIKVRNVGFDVAFLKTVTFQVSRVYAVPLLLQPSKVRVSWNYDIELPVRDGPFSASFEVAQVVGPGRVDYFTLTLRSNTDDVRDYFTTGYIYCSLVELTYNETNSRLVSEPLQFIIPSPLVVAAVGLAPEDYERSFVHLALVCHELKSLEGKKSKKIHKLIAEVEARTRVLEVEFGDDGSSLTFEVPDTDSAVELELDSTGVLMRCFSSFSSDSVREIIFENGQLKIAVRRCGRVLDCQTLHADIQERMVQTLRRWSADGRFAFKILPKPREA